ncbi:MAG: hypothetical protein HQ518_20260 [Rhodopirellula sp.]|nr:hypothetical protein [Rhodopirellula sp.]
MGHQTKIAATNGSLEAAPEALARDVGGFAHDALTLVELQAQLLVNDLQECWRGALIPCLVLFCGIALGLAAFSIALVALALWLIPTIETSYASAFLTAAMTGAVLSSLLAAR